MKQRGSQSIDREPISFIEKVNCCRHLLKLTQAGDVGEKEIFFQSKALQKNKTAQMVKIVQHAGDEEEGFVEMED